MLHNLPKSNSWKLLLILFCLILIFSCQKDNAGLNEPPIIHPDFVTKVTAGNVSGFVTNENNDPVQGATVKIGGSTIITDEYGFFEATNVLVVKQAATVSVTQAGYFNAIKTFMAEEGKDAFFRIKLIPKIIVGTIDAATGGNINTTSGVKITFPTAAIVNAATNAAYTGSVHVAATWLDPTSPELNSIMPGDLRGIDENNAMKLLTTYGMVAVELRGNSWELLQMAPGKKAGLTFPIPSSILSSAPASIPLWSFDEEKGLWIEEGSAVKTGNTYAGEVGHFSFWNCDVSNISVQFNCRLQNSLGAPIPFTEVKISYLSNPLNARSGFTDASGYVSGILPGNEQLKLEVLYPYSTNCGAGTAIYSQNFTTGNNVSAPFSLGVITVSVPTANSATVNGTVTDCSNNPVTNGYVFVDDGSNFYRYRLSNTGTYSFMHLICNIQQTVSVAAEDGATNQQNSNPVTFTINPGINTAPNIQACGMNLTEFFNISINGNATYYKFPDSLQHLSLTVPVGIPAYEIYAYRPSTQSTSSIYFKKAGIAAGSAQQLVGVQVGILLNNQFPATFVNITELGLVGQFISGNFNGVFTGAPPSTAVYNIIGNFRVRRRF